MSVASTGILRQLRDGDGENGAAGAEVERVSRPLAPHHPVDHFEAAGGGAVMAGAEGKAGLDLDGDLRRCGSAPRSCAPCTKKRPARTGFSPSSERATQSMSGKRLRSRQERWPVERRTMRRIPASARPTSSVADIERDLVDIPGLVDFEDGEREAVVLEGLLRARHRCASAALARRRHIQPCLAHACSFRARRDQPSAARRFSLAIAVSALFAIGDGAGKFARAIEQQHRGGVVHRVVAGFERDLLANRCRTLSPSRPPCRARR